MATIRPPTTTATKTCTGKPGMKYQGRHSLVGNNLALAPPRMPTVPSGRSTALSTNCKYTPSQSCVVATIRSNLARFGDAPTTLKGCGATLFKPLPFAGCTPSKKPPPPGHCPSAGEVLGRVDSHTNPLKNSNEAKIELKASGKPRQACRRGRRSSQNVHDRRQR